MLFTVDVLGRVSSWNSGAERLLGDTEAEMVGQEFSRIFTSEDIQNRVPEKQLQAAAREGRAEDERWHVRKDGHRILVAGALASIGGGETRQFGKILRDITERRKTEEALLQTEAVKMRAGGQKAFTSEERGKVNRPLIFLLEYR